MTGNPAQIVMLDISRDRGPRKGHPVGLRFSSRGDHSFTITSVGSKLQATRHYRYLSTAGYKIDIVMAQSKQHLTVKYLAFSNLMPSLQFVKTLISLFAFALACPRPRMKFQKKDT